MLEMLVGVAVGAQSLWHVRCTDLDMPKKLKPQYGPTRATTLPTDSAARKTFPIASGFLDYFPDAIVAVAHVSYEANAQHNGTGPLHWAREKSTDEDDALMRHMLMRGTIDEDGLRHTAKLAWRAMALLQKELEKERS